MPQAKASNHSTKSHLLVQTEVKTAKLNLQERWR